MFNPSETGLHGPYITRKMRRRAERQLPPDQRRPKTDFRTFVAALRQYKPDARMGVNGRSFPGYLLYEIEKIGSRMVAAFRHPTKAATGGRMFSVTVS